MKHTVSSFELEPNFVASDSFCPHCIYNINKDKDIDSEANKLSSKHKCTGRPQYLRFFLFLRQKTEKTMSSAKNLRGFAIFGSKFLRNIVITKIEGNMYCNNVSHGDQVTVCYTVVVLACKYAQLWSRPFIESNISIFS